MAVFFITSGFSVELAAVLLALESQGLLGLEAGFNLHLTIYNRGVETQELITPQANLRY